MPPFFCAAKSNFKKPMVLSLHSPPPRQSPQRGRQITACRDWRSKNETDASSLVEVCFFLKATFVQRMRPRRILQIMKINIDSFAPAQLIRRISRPAAPPSELPCGSLSSTFPKGLDCLKNSVCWQVLLPVNPKNPAILSRKKIGTTPASCSHLLSSC